MHGSRASIRASKLMHLRYEYCIVDPSGEIRSPSSPPGYSWTSHSTRRMLWKAAMATPDEKTAQVADAPAYETKRMDIDDAELETAGYKRAMPRQFSTLSLLALSFDLTGTWLGNDCSVQRHELKI